MIEVRDFDQSFLDILIWGYEKEKTKVRRLRWFLKSHQILGLVFLKAPQVIFVRKSLKRVPIFRRFVLWHERQHIHLWKRYGFGKRSKVLNLSHDLIGVFAFPIWVIYQAVT